MYVRIRRMYDSIQTEVPHADPCPLPVRSSRADTSTTVTRLAQAATQVPSLSSLPVV